ncbi:hypothetical protein VNO77_28515 [Canavalia gladiata]|uniref:Uncharacterized protein n=1 Tax=Canavalia gladiata TaxID=3824 RepID=A0AAN9KW61_CANGL
MAHYYMHESKRLTCFVIFVFMILPLMETSLSQARRVYHVKDIGRSKTEVEIRVHQMKRLGTLASLLPKGSVPPSAPSPDIN